MQTTRVFITLKILVAPLLPEGCTYKVLCDTLIEHFDTPKNKYAESVKFRHIIQKPGESIAQFALRLWEGAVHCEYETFLERMLIEQLLHGLLSEHNMCDEII